MTMPLWTVAAYALQLAALVTVAFAATWLLRIRVPRHSLRFWQTVLAIALLAPLAQPRSVNNPAALAVHLPVDLDNGDPARRHSDRCRGPRQRHDRAVDTRGWHRRAAVVAQRGNLPAPRDRRRRHGRRLAQRSDR